MKRTGQFIPYCVLLLALIGVTFGVSNKTLFLNDYPRDAHAFGYLNMAEEIRQADAQDRDPNYAISDSQIEVLLSFFRGFAHVHPSVWNSAVGPHSYRYIPTTELIAPEFFPGTAKTLSLLPKNNGIASINAIGLLFCLIFATIVLFATYRKRSWAGAAFGSFFVLTALVMYERIGERNYAVNIAIPITIASIYLALSTNFDSKLSRNKEQILAFVSGTLFGHLFTCLPSALVLLVGFSILLKSKYWMSFIVSFSIFGLLPTFLYQDEYLGHYLAFFYPAPISHGFNLDLVISNLKYYALLGSGGKQNWGLWVTLTLLLAYLFFERRKMGYSINIFSRPILAAISTYIFAVFIFAILGRLQMYDLYLPILFANLVLCLSVVAEELGSVQPVRSKSAHLLALTIFIWGTLSITQPQTRNDEILESSEIPEYLMDNKAWVWSDRHSGTFWYYGKKVSFPIGVLPRWWRYQVYNFINKRSEPQYLVRDGAGSDLIYSDWNSLGVKTTEKSSVFGMKVIKAEFPIE